MRRKNANTKAVYWVPIYEVLENAGIEAFSFDGRQTRHVSGRKTDVLDCLWRQKLHSHGLVPTSSPASSTA